MKGCHLSPFCLLADQYHSARSSHCWHRAHRNGYLQSGQSDGASRQTCACLAWIDFSTLAQQGFAPPLQQGHLLKAPKNPTAAASAGTWPPWYLLIKLSKWRTKRGNKCVVIRSPFEGTENDPADGRRIGRRAVREKMDKRHHFWIWRTCFPQLRSGSVYLCTWMNTNVQIKFRNTQTRRMDSMHTGILHLLLI